MCPEPWAELHGRALTANQRPVAYFYMEQATWQRFGEALANERKAAGFPCQVHLARATDIQAVELCRYESGRRLPSLPVFARLTGAGLDPLPLLAALDAEPDSPAEQGTAQS